MKKTFFIVITFLACSCGVGSSIKSILQVGSKIAGELGANNCEISYSTNTSSGHGTSKKVTITLQGLGEEQQTQPRVKIASIAVMLYYQSFDPKEKVKYEDTEVIINVRNDHFETIFLKSDIDRAFRLFNPINKFFDMEKSKDFSSWKQLIDTTFISDSAFMPVETALSQIDSVSGKLDQVIITGFAPNTLEGSGEQVTSMWVETANGKDVSFYNFIFMNESEKIIHIGINEADPKKND